MQSSRFFLLSAVIAAGLGSLARADEQDQQYYEVRSYLLGEQGDRAAIDSYLQDAYLPALARQQIGPVGVFTNSSADETGSDRIVVVIPYDSPDQLAQVRQAVAGDETYRQSAETYLSRGPKDAPYKRIQSELLVAMECMPELKAPSGTLENPDRVFELRVYESANERLGELKVEMFNAGEVPIFLDAGIQPVFLGECLLGPQLPSLTYLTVYENDAARVQAWKAFFAHPDWKVLSKTPKYQGTVSRADKFVLVPTEYSQM